MKYKTFTFMYILFPIGILIHKKAHTHTHSHTHTHTHICVLITQLAKFIYK